MLTKIHKVTFSRPSLGQSHTEYVLGTYQKANDYAIGTASGMGAIYDVLPVHVEGDTIQIKDLVDSEIIRILF